LGFINAFMPSRPHAYRDHGAVRTLPFILAAVSTIRAYQRATHMVRERNKALG
jgi:hypothetical protein